MTLSPEARARQSKFRRSILDFVTDDTRKLQSNLGPTDRRKLDEYLSSVRELEVVDGNPLLAQAAKVAVQNWRYQPTRLNGEPVEVETYVTVNFILN